MVVFIIIKKRNMQRDGKDGDRLQIIRFLGQEEEEINIPSPTNFFVILFLVSYLFFRSWQIDKRNFPSLFVILRCKRTGCQSDQF